MFFFAKNLTEQTLHTGQSPWDFKLTEILTGQIRGDKQARQEWYKNTSTNHFFYTLIEPANPNIRPSKDNAPLRLHGFAVDFDAKLPDARIAETLESFPYKPSWVERSLGGNARLVWLFETPLRVDSYDFCVFLLEKAVKWLCLDLLPGLDEPAFTDPARLLCNGCIWRATGVPHINPADLQAFYVKCGRDFRFRSTDANAVPLDVVEKEIKTKFPNFVWPSEFVVGSQGPSFWVEGSESSHSAIVKPEGMFTFAGHAQKSFYSWGDILGAAFVKQFAVQSIALATADIWYDGKHYWKRDEKDRYRSNSEKDILNFLRMNCNLSTKPGKDGKSPVDMALNHLIHGAGRIVGAAPFIFRPPGIVDYQGEKKLNISNRTVMKMAAELSVWGPEGKFPWLSAHFDRFFASPEQLDHFLAWWKVFYESGLYNKPYPGQNVFLMGGVNVGKTLTSRAIVGLSVGGFVDASEFLIRGGGFNSELLEAPLWCSDDETFAESNSAQVTFQAMMKKCAANQEHLYSKKYEVPCMVEHAGRIICTCNLDFISGRTLGTLDNSSLDKTHLFLCAKENNAEFPDRYTLRQIIDNELPYLLRYLVDGTPPPWVVRDVRYGYAAYHHPALLDKAHQSSRAAPFKELLIEALIVYFTEHPEALEWRGSETAVNRLIQANPMNERITRSLRVEHTGRYLETIQKEGIVKCETETGEMKTKIWVFKRTSIKMPPSAAPAKPNIPPTTEGKTIFEK